MSMLTHRSPPTLTQEARVSKEFANAAAAAALHATLCVDHAPFWQAAPQYLAALHLEHFLGAAHLHCLHASHVGSNPIPSHLFLDAEEPPLEPASTAAAAAAAATA
eukprot:CAMPEP_0197595256 /NCGR_PEP_ID=MMETSP1326-20131121/22425_1 /TAXON_ID=1155430 /ORGANISM="Genus nov. species nov., Strain RCC2288" /LENGTH=105 /DNA_ID=CAMNT_0043161571 /DNA_START=236 /DNA_END=549 /DNA_ORIENTATION=-